ncbi:hypothetical protein ACFLU9_01215 [Chloroflexota bacterium]
MTYLSILLIMVALIIIGIGLWAGLRAQKLISKYYGKEIAKELSVDASQEVKTIYDEEKTTGGIVIAESALRSVFIFQVGKPPEDATLDATIIGLRVIESLNGKKSGAIEEILHNAKKRLPDFILSHLDSDYGGAKFHVKAYPMIYSCFYFINATKWLLGEDRRNPLGYQNLVQFTGRKRAEQFIKFIDNCKYELSDKLEAFAETPGEKMHDVGTITTGGASRILYDLGPEITTLMNFGKKELQKIASFANKCRIEIKPNGTDPYGFCNRLDSDQPETHSTRHALALFDALRKLEEFSELKWRMSHVLDAEGIAGFFKTCKKRDGFSRVVGEKPSIYYTDQVICCRNYYPFNKDITAIRNLITYEEILNILKLQKSKVGYGFSTNSPPNIYATRAAALLLVNIREIFAEDERDVSAEEEIESEIKNQILAFFDLKTGLAVGYRSIKAKDLMV